MTVATTMEQALSKAIKARKATMPQSFLEREFPDGPGVKLCRVGVADAYELLTGTRNVDNRNVSPTKVAQYARDIEGGQWSVNGETIKLTADGLLNDGQHRLEAVIKADRAIDTLVVYGVARDSRFTVDQGRPRSAGCYLAMEGVANATTIAAMARMAICFEQSGGTSVKTDRGPTNAEVRAYVHQHSDAIEQAVTVSGKCTSAAQGIAARTMFALWFYLFRDKGPIALEYMWKVQTGDQISVGDTVFRVRERLRAMTRTSRHGQTEVVLRGWLYYRDGKTWRQMTLTDNFPKI